ncbi:MAG: ion transporter [Chitinophagales bacterium]|nr:ion transporter [Chitinophagales bacterium]
MRFRKKKDHKNAMDYVQEISDVIDLKNRLRIIIFDSSTPLGKLFDITLLLFILASIITIVLQSIVAINEKYHFILASLDWFFTVCFLVEYCLRVYAAPDRKKYIFGFFGIIDFIAVFPSIFSLLNTGYQTIQVVRIVRLLRVFKVLRLFKFISEAYTLAAIMKASLYKISIFMSLITVIVILLGSGMYVIEEGTPGFESIPASIYWGIVTITTVGFGDVTPYTPLGKFIASIIMLAGYAIIAVPTAIWSYEIAKAHSQKKNVKFCGYCHMENDVHNKFCRECGNRFKMET